MYKVVAFDVDGTVVDTRVLLNAARDAYSDVRGYALSDELCAAFYGTPNEKAQELFGFTGEEISLFWKQFLTHLPKYLPQQKLFDGMRETMETLRQMGVLLALNTSRTMELTLEGSRQLDWDFASFCDHVVTCDIVENPKPAPDPLYRVKELCGCQLSEILFVGDTVFDAECAANAGVDFALATWGSSEQLPAKFYPQNPTDLLEIVKQS